MIGRMVIASILPLPLTTPTNVPQWIYGNISAMRIKTKRWTNVIDDFHGDWKCKSVAPVSANTKAAVTKVRVRIIFLLSVLMIKIATMLPTTETTETI